MNVLLVYPEFPRTYWGFQYSLPLTAKRASLPPLGLATLAALLPERWHLRLVDTNVRPLAQEDITWADVVLTGGMLIQTPSMNEIVARARALGRPVIVGGPGPTTSPELYPDATHVFAGEAEGRIDELARAVESPGSVPRTLEAPAKRPDLTSLPVPRYDLVDLGSYASMSLQYSRGCPYTCEFCDIIEIYGRYPRVKTAAQVKAELASLYRLGWRGTVFFVDDNLIGNKPAVVKLLPEVAAWQAEHGNPFELYTEASLGLASDEALIRSMVDAGFSSVFLGIETPSGEALKETKKHQNLRLDLTEAVHRLNAAGLEVMAGFIVGFDSDGPDIFEEQLRFISGLPIPLAMIGILTALPSTALWRRLEVAGRLRGGSNGDALTRPNFVPTMDEATLLSGYRDLLARVYSPDAYYERCRAQVELGGAPRMKRALGADRLLTFLRTLWGIGVKSPNRGQFWRLLFRTLFRSPSAVPRAVGHAVRGEHLIRYTHEDVLPRIEEALADVRREPAALPAPKALAVRAPPRRARLPVIAAPPGA